MKHVVRVIVNCRRDVKIIQSYIFEFAIPLEGPTSPPSREEFVAQTQAKLVTDRVAFPPYDGIEFEVVYP